MNRSSIAGTNVETTIARPDRKSRPGRKTLVEHYRPLGIAAIAAAAAMTRKRRPATV